MLIKEAIQKKTRRYSLFFRAWNKVQKIYRKKKKKERADKHSAFCYFHMKKKSLYLICYMTVYLAYMYDYLKPILNDRELVTWIGSISSSSIAFLFLDFDAQAEANVVHVGTKELLLSWSVLNWAELLNRFVMSARGFLRTLLLVLFLKDWTFTGTGLVCFVGGIFSLLLWSQRATASIGWWDWEIEYEGNYCDCNWLWGEMKIEDWGKEDKLFVMLGNVLYFGGILKILSKF